MNKCPHNYEGCKSKYEVDLGTISYKYHGWFFSVSKVWIECHLYLFVELNNLATVIPPDIIRLCLHFASYEQWNKSTNNGELFYVHW